MKFSSFHIMLIMYISFLLHVVFTPQNLCFCLSRLGLISFSVLIFHSVMFVSKVDVVFSNIRISITNQSLNWSIWSCCSSVCFCMIDALFHQTANIAYSFIVAAKILLNINMFLQIIIQSQLFFRIAKLINIL